MTGRPVALIHGMGSSFEHNWVTPGWRDLLNEAGRTTIPIELPGHGQSPYPGDHEAAAVIADEARRAGGIDAVGFSAGALALLVAASRAPELFGSIAVLGVGDLALAEEAGNREDWRAAVAAALESGSDPVVAMSPNGQLPQLIRRLVRSAGNDPQAVAAYVRSAQPAPRRADLVRITARCLVVEGDRDMVGPADDIVRTIASCARVVLKGVDHYAIPADFGCLDAVLDFLGG